MLNHFSVLIKPLTECVVSVWKRTSIGVLNPAEGYGAFFDALTKAEQKGAGLFFLQQGPCSLPTYEPHDQTATDKMTVMTSSSNNSRLPVALNH